MLGLDYLFKLYWIVPVVEYGQDLRKIDGDAVGCLSMGCEREIAHDVFD